MKKHFLSLMALVAIALCAKAQAKIEPAAGQNWWTYCDYTDESQLTHWGYSSPETFDCAIKLAASDKTVNGAMLHAVRFYLRSTEQISDVKVWVSRMLPRSIDYADVVVSVPAEELHAMSEGPMDVALPEPYEVTGDTYVGYTFTVGRITSNAEVEPIVTCPTATGNTDENAFFLRSEYAYTDWFDFSTDWDMYVGNLAMKVLISNNRLGDGAVELTYAGDGVAVLGGGMVDVPIEIMNNVFDGLSAISYTIDYGDHVSEEYTFDFPVTADDFGKPLYFYIPVFPDTKPGYNTPMLTITKVNGKPNTAINNNALAFPLITVVEPSLRRVAVEEFTGTWCGYCPSGIVAMNRFAQLYPDRYVGIAVHFSDGQSVEPMQCNDYYELAQTVQSVPSAFFNRTWVLNPYTGSEGAYWYEYQPSIADFERCMDRPTEAAIEVHPVWDEEDPDIFYATTDITFQYDRETSPYGLAYVLLEDGMHGDGRPWMQHNYFSQMKSIAEMFTDEEMLRFVNGDDYVGDMVYDDVAVAAWNISKGQIGSVKAPIVQGKQRTHEFAASIGSNTVYQNRDNLKLAVLLINNENKKVVNCAVAKIAHEEETPTSINEEFWGNEELRMKNEESVYDLQGRVVGRVSRSEMSCANEKDSSFFTLHSSFKKGLYIVNGKKVVIR